METIGSERRKDITTHTVRLLLAFISRFFIMVAERERDRK